MEPNKVPESNQQQWRCPLDNTPLRKQVVGGVVLNTCPRCGGMWFAAGGLDEVLARAFADPDGVISGDRRAGARLQQYGYERVLRCPQCGREMVAGRYGGGVSSVELDRCPGCGGAWADGGELAALVEDLCRPSGLGSARAMGEAIAGAVRERERWKEINQAGGELGRRASPLDLFLPKIILPLGAGVQVQNFPVVTVLLVLLCSGVFLVQVLAVEHLQQFFLSFGLVPQQVSQGRQLWGLVTHMFVHGGWLHLLGNMFYLWIFARAIEDELGPVGFLWQYLLCGLIGSLVLLLVQPQSPLPAVGASGAISGVMGMFLVRHPRARIPTLFIRYIVHVPAWLYLGLWVLLQLLALLAVPAGCSCSVAYSAHIGGFAGGLALAWLYRRRSSRSR